jgi:hypothetical protein
MCHVMPALMEMYEYLLFYCFTYGNLCINRNFVNGPRDLSSEKLPKHLMVQTKERWT